MYEPGPFKVFTRIRGSRFVHDEDGYTEGAPASHILGCVWCLSVWVACILIVLPQIVSLVFAVSAGSIIVNGVIKRWL